MARSKRSFSRSLGPQIHIRNIAFAGAGEAELPLLESAAKKLLGADFSRSILRTQEDKNFLPIYLQRGYLKATFGDAQAKVVEGSPQETAVDVTFPVDPGRQYKLTAIEIAGYKSFSAEDSASTDARATRISQPMRFSSIPTSKP